MIERIEELMRYNKASVARQVEVDPGSFEKPSGRPHPHLWAIGDCALVRNRAHRYQAKKFVKVKELPALAASLASDVAASMTANPITTDRGWPQH